MDKFELARLLGDIENRMLGVRDRLQVILDGEIERGHCVAGERVGLGGRPGKRKVRLDDAREIAKHCIAIINRLSKELRDR